jgi:hypothetical protein
MAVTTIVFVAPTAAAATTIFVILLLFCLLSATPLSVHLPFTSSLAWLVAVTPLVAPPPPPPLHLIYMTHRLLLSSSCCTTSTSCCLEAPPAFKTLLPLCPLATPPLLPLICWLVVATPLIVLLPPLVLLMLRHLFADASSPVWLLFASWLLHHPVVMTPPHFILSTRRLCLATHCHLLSTSPPVCLLFAGWFSCCILSCRLHLASPFAGLLPHVSTLVLPPSFAPAGCCIASHGAASASCPLVNTAAS